MEIEKQKNNTGGGACKVYACFEEPQTLKVSEGKVTYKGATEDYARKPKDFSFESVSFLTQKLRHTHNPIIKQNIDALLKGKSSAVLILGNDEPKKQKILIGESQNQGFLLNFLATLFETCYARQLDDRVTIKLSGWEQRDGRVGDLLGGTGGRSGLSNWVHNDSSEGSMMVGIPQIMIRNMKSALKVIRIFMKSLELNRQQGQQTQNLVFTIKLEMDNASDKQGKVTEYLLSKFHIVKLSHPYTTKAPTKHNPWFVSLFNFLQAQTLQKSHIQESSHQDQFSIFIKDVLVKEVSHVHCLNLFSNKMTANDCLTALKFGGYLQNMKIQAKRCILNVDSLISTKLGLQGQLCKSWKQQREWSGNVCEWLPGEEASLWLDLDVIVSIHLHLMQAHNILEYEYANLLTSGCDRLEKYIYSQEVEDYFYAKKVLLEPSSQLQSGLCRYLEMRKHAQQIQVKFIKKLNILINKIKRENSQVREWKYLVNSKIRSRQQYQQLFQIYSTLSTHFLYEKNQDFAQQLMPEPQPTPQEEPVEISTNIEMAKQMREIRQKEAVESIPETVVKKESKKKKGTVDEMEMMFTNTNVSFCTRKHRA